MVLTGSIAVGAMTVGNRWVNDFVREIPKLPKSQSKGLVDIDPGDPQTYLVIGSDTRANVDVSDAQAKESLCDPVKGCDESARSDSMILVHINPNEKNVFAVSIPRDLRVTVEGRKSKINGAFSLGGAAGLIKALDENFHIIVNHIAVIDFQQFQEINRVVGGVHIPFPFPARDRKIKVEWQETGCVNLDPGSALSYVRSRAMEEFRGGRWVYADATPDIGRIGRQQSYFRRLVQKAAGSAGDINGFVELAEEVKKFVQVDQGFSETDFLKLVNAMSRIDVGSDTGIEMTIFPWKDAGNKSDLVPDDALWPAVRDRLNGAAFTEAPAAKTRLRVLNASERVGAAMEVSDFFTKFGVQPATPATGNAPELSETTIVKYATGAFEKAKPLKAFLGADVELVQDASITDADVVIILGTNFAGLVDFKAALAASSSIAAAPSTSAPGTSKLPSTTTTTTSVAYPAGYDPKAVECDP